MSHLLKFNKYELLLIVTIWLMLSLLCGFKAITLYCFYCIEKIESKLKRNFCEVFEVVIAVLSMLLLLCFCDGKTIF